MWRTVYDLTKKSIDFNAFHAMRISCSNEPNIAKAKYICICNIMFVLRLHWTHLIYGSVTYEIFRRQRDSEECCIYCLNWMRASRFGCVGFVCVFFFFSHYPLTLCLLFGTCRSRCELWQIQISRTYNEHSDRKPSVNVWSSCTHQLINRIADKNQPTWRMNI